LIPRIGGCGFINHPLTQTRLSFMSRDMKESGGAVSEALVAFSVAWQEVHERSTSSRPAAALPDAGAA